jgi:hypothetical protein
MMQADDEFYDPNPPDRADAERLLRAGSADEICDALVLLAPTSPASPAWGWVGVQCLRLSGHRDPAVRAAAARCLGRIGFAHPGVGVGPAADALRRLAADPDADVAYEAGQALADLALGRDVAWGEAPGAAG